MHRGKWRLVPTVINWCHQSTLSLPKFFHLFILHEICVIGVLYYWVQNIATYQRYPGGDGPHIIGTFTVWHSCYDGAFRMVVYCFSVYLVPTPICLPALCWISIGLS